MQATVEITSINKAAAELQQPTSAIRRAAGELGIQPSHVINSVPHFAAVDLERIARHLQREGKA